MAHDTTSTEDQWEGVMAAQQLMIELSKLIATRTADLVQG